MNWASAYSHFHSYFSHCYTTIIQHFFADLILHLLVSACAWPPRGGSLSTDSRPFLKRLNHSFVWVGLKATSPNTCWIFRIVSIWVSPSFWQNLMQYLCPICSVITIKFSWKYKIAKLVLCDLNKHFTEKEWLAQSAWNFSQLRMNVCVCAHALVERCLREKKSRILFEQTSYLLVIMICIYEIQFVHFTPDTWSNEISSQQCSYFYRMQLVIKFKVTHDRIWFEITFQCTNSLTNSGISNREYQQYTYITSIKMYSIGSTEPLCKA